jgi:hypothetical protein
LSKAYSTEADPAHRKETAYYQTWRDAVADMMTEPRHSVKYNNRFPDDEGWKQSCTSFRFPWVNPQFEIQ